MASEQFSLCWDNFHKNMSSGMNSLLENEDLVDVTLAIEGKYLKAHKMVLSVCSPYFRELFKVNPCKHPIVFMKDVSYTAMSDLLQFMYQGEVQVSQENLTTFIKTAEALQIKGLTGDGNGTAECEPEHAEESKIAEVELPKPRPKKPQSAPTPPAKRQRVSESTATPNLAITKTELAALTPHAENLVQFKMEPYDQGNSSLSLDDHPEDAFNDDPLDDANADDGNEDYTMMEGGDEEPQAGTSTDGAAGEGQGVIHIIRGNKNPKILLDQNEFVITHKNNGSTRWRCNFYHKTKCSCALITEGKIVNVYKHHNHRPIDKEYNTEDLMPHSAVIVKRLGRYKKINNNKAKDDKVT